MDFNGTVNLDFGKYMRQIPLTNSFGVVYPGVSDELLAFLFKITPDEKVLDIGGGDNPFSRADVVTEPFLHKSAHRSGRDILPGIRYVKCFAEKLPFADKSFDFAISRQVFEHVQSPGAACREIMRVAKRGFIETPRKKYELLFGPNPAHNWLISLRDNKLVFERRMFVRHPFRHIGLSAVPSSPEGQCLLHYEFANLTNVQFYWEDKFDYEVIDPPDGFDYSNPVHAAEAHLDLAICSLLHGGHFFTERASDAREAVRLKPDWALAHNTLGIILWKQNKFGQAKKAFAKAAELEKRDEFTYNAGLDNPSQKPVIVDFDDSLAIDEKFFGSYIRASSVNLIDLLYGEHYK